jgi:hypothetical protein
MISTMRLSLILSLMFCMNVRAEQFDFVALGDTAYNLEVDLPVYERLIETINRIRPAFSIHVGDTWGALECTEDNHRWIFDWFKKYNHPVVYTPGDNEWTDCRKPEVLEAYLRLIRGEGSQKDRETIATVRQLDNAFAGNGYADTLASLQTIREVFFAAPESLGKKTMPLVRQADVSEFTDVVENARWERAKVVFATVSVPGSGMGFTINDPVRAMEAIERNKANVAWIKATFAEAATIDAKAVVIVMHASMFLDGDGGEFSGKELRGWTDGPYYWVALAIRDLAEKFGRPVLLIHGDFHEFVVDRPFFLSQGEAKPPKYANITRLQVYGAPELRAVKVSVDTKTPWIFSFSPLYTE